MRAKEELLKRQAARAALSAAKRRRSNGSKSTSINIKTLMDAELIKHGQGILTLDYRGNTEHADIDEEGKIVWKGDEYNLLAVITLL